VPTSVIALVTLFVASPVRAETKLMQETEGKETSLASLKQQMKDPAGEFCGAKRSKVVVRVDDLGGIATTTKGRRDIEEDRVLESAQSLAAAKPSGADKGLGLDSTVGANKVLLYNYTLVDHKASAVNADEFRRVMTARIIPGVCEDKEMQFLLQNGVRYRYRYHGKGGGEIATITAGSSDCE
jgi:hypothetical protein